MNVGEPRNPVEKEICILENQILELKSKIIELAHNLPEEEITNYKLLSLDGNKKSLLELFGDKDEMILIHNMGPYCPYCTLWADGFTGHTAYLESRCALVLETDFSVNELNDFKSKRNWNFKTLSSHGTTLKKDMGYKDDKGDNHPGFSTLFKKDGKVYRHATAPFGPGDEYCAVWPMFSRLKNGINGWQPSYNKSTCCK
ncbi:hypothetical protein A9Q84_16120 [Halobacteriovorax marinus]|uniref:Thioredoxin domain-containing protein n=1 Tax=Halobacteriovorax marinus TaxID=97084 RepID=A0A1Y5F845_9BACT|nr:hypothetical protein A9Q84_16120 [Halobacteriovorax marinus]